LFVYSVLKTKEQNNHVKIHGCDKFLSFCEKLNLDVDLYSIVKKTAICDKVFWAYQKIYTYQKMNVGEIHLDIDAVLKEPFDNIENIDIHVAYQDNPNQNFSTYYFPEKTLPNYLSFGNPDGFNMSFVCFNNQKLKDDYTELAIKMMVDNKAKENISWQHMVFVEQAMLKQMCEYNNYSYKYLTSGYYHLGYAKKYLDDSQILLRTNNIEKKLLNYLTQEQINKIKNGFI